MFHHFSLLYNNFHISFILEPQKLLASLLIIRHEGTFGTYVRMYYYYYYTKVLLLYYIYKYIYIMHLIIYKKNKEFKCIIYFNYYWMNGVLKSRVLKNVVAQTHSCFMNVHQLNTIIVHPLRLFLVPHLGRHNIPNVHQHILSMTLFVHHICQQNQYHPSCMCLCSPPKR